MSAYGVKKACGSPCGTRSENGCITRTVPSFGHGHTTRMDMVDVDDRQMGYGPQAARQCRFSRTRLADNHDALHLPIILRFCPMASSGHI
ncbi:MAG: hypothetical protein GY789_10125 [Hyphomicrobiales bacterium]|nr:hypothetical protein [Hyphomicrobiales bacterium]MCP4999449.1 hypothetical protein [Hyphomicrobiales bacterium]